MIIVSEVIKSCLKTEARLSRDSCDVVIERHKERSVILHRDGQAAAVDEELLDDVAPLRLVLVPRHKRRQLDQTVVKRPLRQIS